MTTFRIFTALALVGLTTACAPQSGQPFNGSDGMRGHMRGSMPEISDVDSDLSSGYIETADSFIYLEVNTLQPSGWAMLGVAGYVEEDGSITTDTEDTLVYGCSGAEEYNATFDEDAETSTVEIKSIEVDGRFYKQYDITAIFGNHTMTGTATVPVTPEDDE